MENKSVNKQKQSIEQKLQSKFLSLENTNYFDKSKFANYYFIVTIKYYHTSVLSILTITILAFKTCLFPTIKYLY